MSIEAFLMNYRDGDVRNLAFDRIREILETTDTDWFPDYNCLRATFEDPADHVDIYCGCDAVTLGEVAGLTIARPLRHPDFLNRMFRLLQLDNVMLFYSDESTPIFHQSGDPSHYPTDMLETLGAPRFAATPNDLLHQT